jgi:hypothetical protein
MARRAQAITLRSRRYVHSRSGELAASIHTTAVFHDLPFEAHFDVRAEAEHGLYVHEGTKMVAPIRSNRLPYLKEDKNGVMRLVQPRMRLRPGNGYPEMLLQKVRGQRANRYLVKGMAYALRRETVGTSVLLIDR